MRDDYSWEFALKIIKYPYLLKRGDYNWESIMKEIYIHPSLNGVTLVENLH